MKKSRSCLYVFLTLLVFLTSFSPAVYGSEEENTDVTLSPYFFIEGADPSVDRLPLKGTSVDTTIDGVIANTYVTQTYANEGAGPINARYVFPASTKVSVHGMKMEIGDQVITAKIKEKEVAKQEFEEAKTEGKSASMLSEQRPNVFTMDVANIMPGDTVRIELHYTELITSTEGTYQFVFPTVVGPRYVSPSDEPQSEDGSREPAGSTADSWSATPYLQEGETLSGTYDISVRLSSGVPITDLTSKSHEVNVTWDSKSEAVVTLSNPNDYAGNRDFILDYKLTGEDVNCGLMLHKGESENFFLLMVQPPERYVPENLPPREYIFVLDVSGSMEGFPLETAKTLIKNLVTSLKETDKFNLILFSGDSSQMSPVSLPATSENIKLASELIDRQSGGGGTELAPALENAMNIPVTEDFSRSVVVITDGYLYGEREIFNLVSRNLNTTNFFSFGIGDSVNRYLIDGIAKAGQGESFVVTDAADAEKTADRFRTYIQSPVLTDIKVTYPGFEVYDTEPSTLPDLFAKRPLVLFGKWKGDPAGTIRVTGKAGTEDYVYEIPVSQTVPSDSNEAIRYLWARTKVEQLTDYAVTEEDSSAVIEEVTKLGLDYSMLTPYTSFIAVTETVRNQEGNSTDVKQPLPLPLHVSNLAVGGGYTTGSEPEDFLLILAVLSIAGISTLYKKRKKLLAK